jgi:hypothetical protein
MKKNLIGLYFFALFCNSICAIEISSFTELIYKRYYFIARLEKIIDFYQLFATDPHCNINLFFADNDAIQTTIYLFKHEAIKHSLDEMCSRHSFAPLVALWHDFIAYKFLDDEIFLEDFTKLILILSKKIFFHIIPREQLATELPHNHVIFSAENDLSTDIKRIDYTDALIRHLQEKENPCNVIKSTNLSIDHIKHGYTQSVSKRFYYIQRLKHPIATLLECNRLFFHCFQHSDAVCGIDTKSSFSHEYIKECIKTIETTKALDSLLYLWNDFEHYKLVEDEQFVHEFLKIIFIIQKNIVFYTAKNKINFSLDYFIMIYENIDSLPLEELLNAIDLLTHELPAISQKFELDSDMTWRQWFRKYWWAPPLVAGTIVLKFLIIYKAIKTKMALKNPINSAP